jgi:alkyl hydroperoxide reductase subunit AhpC
VSFVRFSKAPLQLLNWELLQIIIEFEKRNTKVIALSVDRLESHLKWIKDIEETQNVTLQYPNYCRRK